jgi:DNA-directed RNA polymerase subunit RPC12/RpoP
MYLCLTCQKEIDPADPRIEDKAHPHHGGCPECGAKGLPADLATETVTVKVTWHELRILTMWAERWSATEQATPEMTKIVYGIADRLQAQHMERPGLTFRSELAELSGDGFSFEQNVIREDPTNG